MNRETADMGLSGRPTGRSTADERPDTGRLALLADIEHWPLFYHTLTKMERRQLVGVAERTVRQQLLPALPVDFHARYERQIPDHVPVDTGPVQTNNETLRECLPAATQERYRRLADEATAGTLTFLHTAIDVTDDGRVEWFPDAAESLPALWALKFHGFEFLTWPVFGPSDASSTDGQTQDWVEQALRDWDDDEATRIGAPGYLRRAWTPHAVSLRILNQCRYDAWCDSDDTAFRRRLRRCVYRNACFLATHVEHDVGGNHLVENAIALVMAGIVVDEETGWLQTGLDLLDDASEQFLPDGGHFERSPMYHTITLTRYLTAIDLLRGVDRQPPDSVVRAAERAAGFLHALRPPDGEIPLLNDAVFGEALPLDSCLAYARAVGCLPAEESRRTALPTSGYYWVGQGADRLLVDGGPFGPPHLPAHSHNDCLSVCLWLDGTRVVCDTGTYEYAPTARRQYARSVQSHSTVQVGQTEPVDIGGQYLAGRRIDPSVQYVTTPSLTMFDGAYRARGLLSDGYTHRRRIYGDGDWWLLQDRVDNAGGRPVRSRLHLHPAVEVERDGRQCSLLVEGDRCGSILPVGVSDISETTTPYFPEFGRAERRSTLVFDLPTDDPSGDLFVSTDPVSEADYHEARATIAAHDCDDIHEPRTVRE